MKRTWGFVAARFGPGYLGLHLTVGFLVAVLALTAFGTLTNEVVDAESIVRLDRAVHDRFRERATVTGYATFGAITELGSPPVLMVLGLTGTLVFILQRRRGALIVWAAAFLGGPLVDATLKLLIQRPRPPNASDFLQRASFSYPSGHAMMSCIAFGMVAYLFLAQRPRSMAVRAIVVLVMGSVVLLVGLSRLYLGVHYVSDVIAGYIAGAAWLAVCISGLETVRRRALTPQL